MRLEAPEIDALAEDLAPRVAALLAEHLDARPQWAMSVAEAAAWASVPEHVVRQAIADGRLPCIRLGRQLRVRRSDLFGLGGKMAKEATA